MSRLVDYDLVLHTLDNVGKECNYYGEFEDVRYFYDNDIYDAVAALPTVTSNFIGTWICRDSYAECSMCHHKVSVYADDFRSNFCPCCGARMEDKEND